MTNNFYFLNESLRSTKSFSLLSENSEMPIKIKRATWQHLSNPKRLSKTFIFDNLSQRLFFINEIMKSAEQLQHDIKIVLESNTITIETYTHDMNDVTEIDLEIAKTADLIFKDAMYVSVESETNYYDVSG